MRCLQEKQFLVNNNLTEIKEAPLTVMDGQVDGDVSLTIIPRKSCVYTCIPFDGIKKSLQKDRLTLKLNQLTPFTEFDSFIIWKNDQAMVWLWKSTAEKSTQKAIPESLLAGKQQQSETEIIALNSGFEARHWENGVLQGSQFWSQQPKLSDWNNFLRSHSIASTDNLPEIEEYRQNEIPWYQPTALESLIEKSRNVNFPGFGLALFLLILCYQLSGLIRINQSLEETNIEHKITLDKANDIVTARNQALNDLAVVNQLNQLSQWPTQIELLALSSQILHELKASMTNWNYNNGELLLVIKTSNADSTAFVSAFEALGIFESVNLNTQANQGKLALQMILKPNFDLQSKEP